MGLPANELCRGKPTTSTNDWRELCDAALSLAYRHRQTGTDRTTRRHWSTQRQKNTEMVRQTDRDRQQERQYRNFLPEALKYCPRTKIKGNILRTDSKKFSTMINDTSKAKQKI